MSIDEGYDYCDEPEGLGAWMKKYDCAGKCRAECVHAPDCTLKPTVKDCKKCKCIMTCNV